MYLFFSFATIADHVWAFRILGFLVFCFWLRRKLLSVQVAKVMNGWVDVEMTKSRIHTRIELIYYVPFWIVFCACLCEEYLLLKKHRVMAIILFGGGRDGRN